MPLEDLERASRLLVHALQIRQRYMKLSRQSFPTTASTFLQTVNLDTSVNPEPQHHDDKQTIEGDYIISFDLSFMFYSMNVQTINLITTKQS